MPTRLSQLLLFFALISLGLHSAKARGILITNETCSISIVPETLELWISLQKSNYGTQVSLLQKDLGPIAHLKATSTNVSWRFPKQKATITVNLRDRILSAHVRADEPSTFTFPVISETTTTKGWILPMFEGIYAPCGDTNWVNFLIEHGEMNTTADFGMPFLGLNFGHFTLTYIFTNPFNNEIQFNQDAEKRLEARFTHEFTRNHPIKEYGLVMQIGKSSLVEPARLYREWIVGRGEFMTMDEKISRTPEAAKLLGAPHIYLWGNDLLHYSDIRDWKGFAAKLVADKNKTNSVAHRVWSSFQPENQKLITELTKSEWPDKYTKTLVTDDLNSILNRRDFAVPETTSLSLSSLTQQNAATLFNAFPQIVAEPKNWGNGVSTKMISQFVDAGFQRLWLGSDGWQGMINRPETVEAAKKAGYLMGPYDSFHSIHHPNEKETWETAQFDFHLYETGGIVLANGSKKAGFKKKGFVLSPKAARPYVEKRVTSLMDQFHANSWFIDCDGFGEYFDDYSSEHPATQFSDLQERTSRMAWIRDTFGAVIGSEGCSAGVASTIHFAHGIMTPVIGWGDQDMNDKNSPFYLGAYYPKDEPQVHFKSVPIKEEYRYIYFEPRFRLPLFETVFHDSVVATHHWSFASLKTKDHARTIELLELLYNIPPLYHLNVSEFQKRKELIKRHYDFFSQLHRETGVLPMTDFQWLTKNGDVQKTVFGDSIEMIANFSDATFSSANHKIPPQTILAIHHKTGKAELYTPSAP